MFRGFPRRPDRPCGRGSVLARLDFAAVASESPQRISLAILASQRKGPPRLTNSERTNRQIDMGAVAAHFVVVKQTRPAREPKTKGTLIVEEHRPVMNKLTDAQRQQLMRAGMELIYGTPAAPQPARRRR